MAASRQTGEQLDKLVTSVFEHLDDALFEPAGVPYSDLQQSRFLYSVRELRQLRESVSNTFVRQVQKKLEGFFAGDLAAVGKQADYLRHPDKRPVSLELVKHTELEEDLAVLTVIAKGEHRYQNALEQLNGLWSSLTWGQAVVSAKNPLGPNFLTNQFRSALAVWSGDHIVKPLVYDVFYEYLVAQLGELYQGLIDDMRAAGVQPVDMSSQVRSKSAIITRDKPAAKGAHRAGTSATPAADTPENSLIGLVTLIGELFESQRPIQGLPKAVQPAETPLAPMRPDVLIDVLSRLQQQFAEGSVFDLQAAVESNSDFKHTLHHQLGKLKQKQHQQVQAQEQHILDVVIMLFDFVLEDPVMPAPMKVVIARLQIPILQVAIHDRVFLSDRTHPARSLLNNLSRAAVRWVDDGDYTASSLFGMIEQSVNRIVGSKVQDAALYADVDQNFSDYLRREGQAAAIAEERLNQVARGQEQLAAARGRVSRELDRLLNDQLPVAVYKILNDVWRDVLTLTLLREGEGSQSWIRMIEVAERLVDSVKIRDQVGERQKVMRDIPLLLADLREGFFSISYDTSKTVTMFKQLQLCHISVLRGVSPHMQTVSWKDGQHQPSSTREQTHDSKGQINESVRIGQWIRWVEPDGSEKRAKLSWRSEIEDILLFVDCRGRKVIEMTSEDLSNLVRDARAHVIKEIDEPIMDRVMRVIYDMLRQTASERSGAIPA